MQLFLSPVNNFFKFFQAALSARRSLEPLCLSAFSNYAHLPPLCQTLFSIPFVLFYGFIRNHLIKLHKKNELKQFSSSFSILLKVFSLLETIFAVFSG